METLIAAIHTSLDGYSQKHEGIERVIERAKDTIISIPHRNVEAPGEVRKAILGLIAFDAGRNPVAQEQRERLTEILFAEWGSRWEEARDAALFALASWAPVAVGRVER